MFVNEDLKNHFETSSTIKTQSLVIAEWNMNFPDNISLVGNYRYRPTGTEVKYQSVPNIFDNLDADNYYTNALSSDVTVSGSYDNEDLPQVFTLPEKKSRMLFSLEDCLNPFRPRSGINKAVFFPGTLNNPGKYLANSGLNIAQRPRYYMGSRYDQFKYWTSYRTENNISYGIAEKINNDLYYIEDAAPFVVYKKSVPANRLVFKMQTNVGTVDLGPFTINSGTMEDPLYGNANKTTPQRWSIQYLKNNKWVNAYTFDENSTRNDGSPIVKEDGYLELEYGLIVPNIYKDYFKFQEKLSSSTLLPDKSINGYAYLIVNNKEDIGIFYIWDGLTNTYNTFIPQYGWSIGSESVSYKTNFVNDLTSPEYFTNGPTLETTYREFEYIDGLRVVVETMNKFGSTFDLIEMSPRLLVNLSDKVISYNIKKTMSDMGNSSIPVGQLLASTGSLSIFDEDQAFNENNFNSIISEYIRKNIKFTFYENILDVNGYDYSVPIKTLYSESLPNSDGATFSVDLRDFYFYLESMPAPRLLLTQASLGYAISILMDHIGFSNYVFKRLNNETDPIIPYFFVAPDQNVAEVLNQLAISTQTSIFFDEYNNLVVMSKGYLLPTESERSTDLVLSGSDNQQAGNIIKNQYSGILPNILAVTSKDKKIYNDGKINYTTRYIQRSAGTIKQASMIDQNISWIYKPVLLWEVAGTDALKTANEAVSQQSKYALSAMPLNSNLSENPPYVENHILKNNTIDFGENIYWITRYQGYFYANGEIIKYDAVQFNVTGIGNVWISNNQEYQKYFSSIPFNGKIYPTGLVRIFSTPYYETIDGVTRLKNGSVFEHGRAQFGTEITNHPAGAESYWTNNSNVRGCNMQSKYLFSTLLNDDLLATLPSTAVGAAGVANDKATKTSRNGIIKNFMALNYLTETEVNNLTSTQSGTVQSSALVMNGPSFTTEEKPIDFISYVYKNHNNVYKNFGTRMRIVGKIENNDNRVQTPVGSTTYYQVNGNQPDQNVSIGGGSGGLAVLLNPETNNGYYFEIAALTEGNIESYLNIDTNGQSSLSINNVLFYKIKKDSSNNNAIPIKLWGGLSKILVDDGRFTGQYRMVGEENPTVYDLQVEYQDIGTTRRFYLYINGQLIKTVDDSDPLPLYNNSALFVRGSSRCMFENFYAVSENYAQNTVFTVGKTLSEVFGTSENKEINANEAFRKYAMSGIIKSTYLSGISSLQPPKYNIYFDEFGTIMRECAYFNIKYDRAYPALYSQLSPTFNRIKGYVTSGFYADSYGAEFLIFNATDTTLNLDETSGNYLRIQGVTFTQDTTHQLTVDDYFAKKSNQSNPTFVEDSVVYSPLVEKQKYDNIKLSRLIYGKNEFTLETPYIQTDDDANNLLGWMINKTMIPRKAVGVSMFATPTIQLGDIVTIDYKDENGVDYIASSNSRFIVYNIEYSRDNLGPQMTVYLSEV